LLRLAPLSLSLSLVACATDDAGSAEPISSQEAAMTQQAVEGAVVAMAPATSNNLATIAAAYRASFTIGGASCATVATDDLTFVTVTFACGGALATTGSIDLRLASPTTLEATADLTIGGVSLDGSLELTVPLAPSAERTFEGQLTITGSQRTLTVDAAASWIRDNGCVTYSAAGNVVAEGPRGSASATFEVDGKTVCGV
jgi:outer membrane lipoprotein SlyB